MTLSEQLKNAGIKFYHANFLLPDGSRTAFTENGVDSEPWRQFCCLDQIDYKNKSVLDVGCWDGAWAFQAERLGATRVVGLDDVSRRMWGINDNSAWEALHKVYNSKATYVHGQVQNLPFDAQSFDIVLCLGLLYHLTDPLTGLNECFRVAKEYVVVETHADNSASPTLTLLAPREANPHDPTNVYRLSSGWVKKVAQMNGFELVRENCYLGHRYSYHFVRKTSVTNLHPASVK